MTILDMSVLHTRKSLLAKRGSFLNEQSRGSTKCFRPVDEALSLNRLSKESCLQISGYRLMLCRAGGTSKP